MFSRRHVGWLGTSLLVLVGAAIGSAFLRSATHRGLQRRVEKLRGHFWRQIAEVKSGSRRYVEIPAPICVEDLVADPECRRKVTAVYLWSDLSDERWALLKQLSNLEAVHIYDSASAEAFLKNIQGMETLERLTANVTPLSDAALRHVSTFPKLKELRLEGCGGVSNVGIRYLRGHSNLERVELVNSDVTDEGLSVFTEIPRLRSLVLSWEAWRGQRLTDAGLEHLHELRNLETLELRGGWASERAVRQLQAALPRCKIKRSG